MKTQKLNVTQPNKSRFVTTLKGVILIITISLLSLTSCKSDENNQENIQQPDGVALNNRFKENRQDAIQEFDLDISTGGNIAGSQGTEVYFPPNSLGINGNAVSGNVKIQLIEIYGKSAMVLQNKSTKGKKANDDEEVLNSAGEFFINATQNGTQLEVLQPVTIKSRGILPADYEQMNIFKAGDNLEDESLWEEVDENGDQEPDQAQGGEGEGTVNGTQTMVLFSTFSISSFGWSNLDRWYNYTGQLTDLFVDVPDGYNDDNCAVYLSYDGETGLARMDRWDATQQMFTEHFGRIPVGQEVHFIMLAEIGGVLHYAIQPATITDGHIEVINSLQPISEADLTTLLEALP